MKNQRRNPACRCGKFSFIFPASSSFSRMMKPAESSLIDPLQLLNKPLEGGESFWFILLSPLLSSIVLLYLVDPPKTILYSFDQQSEFIWPSSGIYRASPVCFPHLSGSVFASINICWTNENVCLSSSPFPLSSVFSWVYTCVSCSFCLCFLQCVFNCFS